MKPLKVLVYPTTVVASKVNELKPVPSTLVEILMGQSIFFALTVSDIDGTMDAVPLNEVEVLPGQFDTEVVISVDVPGAINNALNPDSL